MGKVVLDTSAILTYLGVISSVSYAELTSKLVDKGMPLEAVISAIENLELTFVAQDQQQHK